MAKRLIVAACLCILSTVESRGGGIHSSPSHNRIQSSSAFSSTSPSLLPSSSYYYTHHTKLSPRWNHQLKLIRPTTNTFNCISSQSTILLHKQQRVNAAKISNLYLSSSASPTQEEVTPTKKQITASFNSKSNDNDNDDDDDEPIILIIGGSGFLGTEIRKQLKDRDIPYVATATTTTTKVGSSEEEEFVSLDLTASNSEEQFYKLIATTTRQQQHGSNNNRKKKVAVISAMGSIGTNQDEKVNAALSRAIRGAYRINNDNYEEEDENEKIVERFVMIGNTERVRRLASNLPFLKGYASGKEVRTYA